MLAEIGRMENTMKKIMRIISIALCLVITTSTLFACSKDELDLYKAMKSFSKVSSFESSTKISYEMKTLREPSANSDIPKKFSIFFNNWVTTANAIYQKDTKTGKSSAYIKSNFGFSDLSGTIEAWMSLDEKNISNSNYTYKMPTVIKLCLPADYIDKDFAVLDLNKMNQQENGAELKDVSAQEIQELFYKVFDYYTTNFKTDVSFVKSAKSVAGGKLYTITISDKEFKKLLRSIVNDFFKNKETREMLKNFTKEYVNILKATSPVYEQVDVDTIFSDIEQNAGSYEVYMSLILDAIDKIKILGDEGIKQEVLVDKSGMIKSEDFKINLSIDLDQIEKIVTLVQDQSDAAYEQKNANGAYSISMIIHTDYNSINKKVTIPPCKANSQNSIDIYDEMKKIEEKSKEEMKYYFPWNYEDFDIAKLTNEQGIKVKGEFLGTQINSTVKLIEKDYELYTSAKDISNVLGATLKWDDSTGIITISFKDRNVSFTTRDLTDEQLTKVDEYLRDAIIVDGRSYISLGTIEDQLGLDFGLDNNGDESILLIRDGRNYNN